MTLIDRYVTCAQPVMPERWKYYCSWKATKSSWKTTVDNSENANESLHGSGDVDGNEHVNEYASGLANGHGFGKVHENG